MMLSCRAVKDIPVEIDFSVRSIGLEVRHEGIVFFVNIRLQNRSIEVKAKRGDSL